MKGYLLTLTSPHPTVNLDGVIFHKNCAKCNECNCQITLSNLGAKDGSGEATVLLCKTHHLKRFHLMGSYIGGQKYKRISVSDRDIATTLLLNSMSAETDRDECSVLTTVTDEFSSPSDDRTKQEYMYCMHCLDDPTASKVETHEGRFGGK